ncbi:hypothetical protein [Vibrio sp. ABG19]|uniref:hypothetical protein n=1 Tax=Vibrio sp. ABG19 TaxID=2817385 RepID=UPI00249E888F|nr:hypothetical protein [Vibrio sp. ABG19]WGY45600.1 hypothetical protein J0X00_01780 [Vibrio sp. ABG19]
MISENELQQLKEKLYSSESIFSWEYTGIGSRIAIIWRWLLVIVAGLIPLVFLVVSDLNFNDILFWINIIICVGMMFATRYLFFSDRSFHYYLTSVGIHYSEQVAVPDTAYAVVRGFAWVGMAVCIVALVLIGPLAFVGVGGCALLSFGLTNFKPEVLKKELYFSDHLVIFDPIKDTIINLDTETTNHPRFSRTLFFSSFDEKNNFISEIKKVHNNVEHNLLRRLNDQYKHPIFNQELTDD